MAALPCARFGRKTWRDFVLLRVRRSGRSSEVGTTCCEHSLHTENRPDDSLGPLFLHEHARSFDALEFEILQTLPQQIDFLIGDYFVFGRCADQQFYAYGDVWQV